jgi:hypothetical protein
MPSHRGYCLLIGSTERFELPLARLSKVNRSTGPPLLCDR